MKNKFQIKEHFWTYYQNLIQEVVIPFQEKVLNDKVPDIEKSHAMENFRIAAGEAEGEFYGMVFQDSDVAKWIEAASYALMLKPNTEVEKKLDNVITLIGKVQQPDGYLNTYFTVKEPNHKWQNLQEAHELYCSGHMIEAAVAHYEATGKITLLSIMKKNADHIYHTFGKDKRRGFPGHPEIELALVRLYRVTGDKRYLELSQYFINERGTSPNFFKEEKGKRDWSVWNSDPEQVLYTLNQAPVREQQDAVGHAVRAVYLYAGMAEVGKETGDESLIKACETLWNSITQKQMYITGGIGSTHIGEAFTKDYDLPNDTAYSETCASIGLIFFAQKMLEATLESKYADVIEKALYNCVLAGMSLDGKKFFYTNPLEVNPEYAKKIVGFEHICAERPGWFSCACCPPNVARLIASLNRYIFTETEEAVYFHLFIGGELDLSESKKLKIQVTTEYPYNNVISYRFQPVEAAVTTTIAIRIPDWSETYQLIVNGEKLNAEQKNGYVFITKKFVENDEIVLQLDMMPKKVYANLNVSENAGCTAIVRGPLVYCFEGTDNGGTLANLRISKDGKIVEKKNNSILMGGVTTLEIDGVRLHAEDALYSFRRPMQETCKLTAIPYYAWANRGENQMRVWMQEE
ncbi:glycoside hydrolase family 127 protein [Anaeromicropila populeti]|uniref:Glycoside hydrolase family 127 protein n=1 Tax=Anaeromicropila populeti TaxID=37658 RepID=A0A1I6J2F7_9FIRM|nr:beta-L-arabinofuranosidase domain-containing protein [Anaeromicropila populeti]SFR73108.1 hypothetical protein SAMN05661086_01381 [Anaeromicropila populeti]